jgi:ferredoxin
MTKKAIVHYFSGTGNTYRVSSLVKKKLEENGFVVWLNSVENGKYAGPSDLDIFAFPVYAYDVPDIMMKYLHGIMPVEKKKAAVIAVHGMLWQKPRVPGDGGDPGYSFEHARRALARKGYDVAYTMAVGYPHSISMLLSTPPSAEQSLIRAASDMRVEEFSRKIAADDRSLQKCGILPAFYSLLPGLLFRFFGRMGLGKLYVADTGCIKCGKCIQSCPSKAIRFSLGRPRWDWKCQGCQRCINICPNNAIQASLFRAFAMFAGLFVPWNEMAYLLLRISVFSPHPGLAGAAIDFTVWALLYLSIFYILEKAFFVLEATPIIGKVMSLNLSSPNRRYLDPLFKAAMNDKTVEKVDERSR